MCDGTCLQYLQEWSLVNWGSYWRFSVGICSCKRSVCSVTGFCSLGLPLNTLEFPHCSLQTPSSLLFIPLWQESKKVKEYLKQIFI